MKVRLYLKIVAMISLLSITTSNASSGGESTAVYHSPKTVRQRPAKRNERVTIESKEFYHLAKNDTWNNCCAVIGHTVFFGCLFSLHYYMHGERNF